MYTVEPLEDMARKKTKLFNLSKRILFSYDKENTYGGYKLGNTEIYEDVGYSASDIILIIKTLLEKYDIAMEDFVYSARLNKKE